MPDDLNALKYVIAKTEEDMIKEREAVEKAHHIIRNSHGLYDGCEWSFFARSINIKKSNENKTFSLFFWNNYNQYNNYRLLI